MPEMLEAGTKSGLLEAALEYAAKGWRVFPCVPRGKTPLTKRGFLDATTDVTTIQRWWNRFPGANIGYALPPKTVVIDIDPRNGGKTPDGLPRTLTALTGGGGYHYYYTIPSTITALRSTIDRGIDIKGNGTGYVLVQPSVTEAEYRWQDADVGISEAPQWLLDKLVKPEVEAYERSEYYDDPTDTRPGTQFNRVTKWEDILTPHGWRLVGSSGGESYWCRPGKSEGISATTNYQNTDLMYVFTSSTVFDAGKSYSKFSAYTELEYGGDYTRAAKLLATRLDTVQFPELRIPTVSEELTNDILCSAAEAPQRNNTSELSRLRGSNNSTRSEDLHPSRQLDGATINTNVVPKYSFQPALPPDHFISRYIEYVSTQTDAPLEYGEASALTLLSLASYKCKSALSPYPGGLANNLYITLVGPTTRSRKSTVQRITSNIIKQVMPPSLLPNRATTEALIKALANRNGVPSVWCPDEFGVTLAEIYNRDYMRGLEEMLLTVYSGDDYEYQRVLDSVIIRSPHLSVLGAATPESISRAGTTALDSGLLPRFAIVYPAVMPEAIPVTQADVAKLRAEKQYFVSKLNEILTWSNTHEDITFEPSALELLNEAESTLQATSAVRLPTMLYKVSALIAIGASRAKVESSDAKAAIAIVQRWADGVAALIPQMYKHGADQQFEQQLEYVLDEMSKHGNSLLRTTIANLINVKKQRLDEIESTLVDKGRIKVLTGEGGKQWHLLP